MPWTDKHLLWLTRSTQSIVTTDGKNVEIWEFQPQDDSAVLSAWAKHFRNHYCLDAQIDHMRNSTGLSRAQYLNTIKFPDASAAPGPSIRAGDFGEILVSDYLQFVLKYWVPRTRYSDKKIRNESTKGCDILGFKILKKGVQSKKDELALFEAKAQLTGTTADPRLQDAIDGSTKDELRKAESLNAIKQKLFDTGAMDDVAVVERFQNFADHPYIIKHGAVAIFSTPVFCRQTISEASANSHPNSANLSLVVIRGDKLMELAHQLYKRAADEA
jgi:hypothetical protein